MCALLSVEVLGYVDILDFTIPLECLLEIAHVRAIADVSHKKRDALEAKKRRGGGYVSKHSSAAQKRGKVYAGPAPALARGASLC